MTPSTPSSALSATQAHSLSFAGSSSSAASAPQSVRNTDNPPWDSSSQSSARYPSWAGSSSPASAPCDACDQATTTTSSPTSCHRHQTVSRANPSPQSPRPGDLDPTITCPGQIESVVYPAPDASATHKTAYGTPTSSQEANSIPYSTAQAAATSTNATSSTVKSIVRSRTSGCYRRRRSGVRSAAIRSRTRLRRRHARSFEVRFEY